MPANPLSLGRQEEIASIVEQILLTANKHYPNDSVISIIKAAIPGVRITETDFDGKTNIRGAIFRKGKDYDTATIAINESQAAGEKTFALAHEFGHYMLGHDGSAHFYIDDKAFDGSTSMQKEGEANFFALILLIPKEQ